MDNNIILNDDVSKAIYELVIPYLKKYYRNIVGIYLYPYKIGDNERIEIVVVHNCEEEILNPSITKVVKGYTIYSLAHNINMYNKKSGGDEYTKLSKELKDGYIIYDPKYNLSNRKNRLAQDEEVTSLYNFINLSDEMVDDTKKKIYSVYKRNK